MKKTYIIHTQFDKTYIEGTTEEEAISKLKALYPKTDFKIKSIKVLNMPNASKMMQALITLKTIA